MYVYLKTERKKERDGFLELPNCKSKYYLNWLLTMWFIQAVGWLFCKLFLPTRCRFRSECKKLDDHNKCNELPRVAVMLMLSMQLMCSFF